MRRLFTVVCLLLATSMLPAASQAPATQAGPRQRQQDLRKRLGLTPDQVARVRAVLLKEAEALKALREKYRGTPQNQRTQIRIGRELQDIQAATEAELKPILTEAQMQEMKKIRTERREQPKSRSGP